MPMRWPFYPFNWVLIDFMKKRDIQKLRSLSFSVKIWLNNKMTLEKFAIAVAFELKKHDIDVVLS